MVVSPEKKGNSRVNREINITKQYHCRESEKSKSFTKISLKVAGRSPSPYSQSPTYYDPTQRLRGNPITLNQIIQ